MSYRVGLNPPPLDEWKKAILAGLVDEIDKVVRELAPRAAQALGRLAARAIREAPEAISLHGGRLQGELGPENWVRDRAIDEVCRAVEANVVVDVMPTLVRGEKIQGGFTLRLLSKGLRELRDAFDTAAFYSEHGFVIDWLRWLLLNGEDLIIADYHFVPGDQRGSRTGLGLMRKKGSWRVPGEFSGTESDNWLTRAIHSALPEFEVEVGRLL